MTFSLPIRLSLRVKLVAINGVVAAICVLLVQSILAERMDASALRRFEARATALTALLGSALGPSVEFEDARSSGALLAGLRQMPEVQFALVRSHSGQRLAGFRDERVGGARDEVPTMLRLLRERDRLRVDLPVPTKSGPSGVLTIGYSLGEAQAEGRQNRLLLLILCGLVIVATTAALAVTSGMLVRSLRQVASVALRIADGDLSQDQLPTRSSDELGQMAMAFNRMVTSQREVVRQIADSSVKLTGAAMELYSAAQGQEAAAAKQSAGVEEVGRTMQSLLDSASYIADSARGVLANAERTKETADATARRITELSNHTNRIAEILEIIRDIAERSDLLALNASLEATRAGEAGRSFALIAGEMRRLAERVTASVQDVKSLVSDIRASGASTVLATEEGRQLSDSTTESARQITVVTQQQRTGTEQVSQSIRHITALLSEAAEAAQRTRSSVAVLKDQAERLSEMVGRFRVDSRSTERDAGRDAPPAELLAPPALPVPSPRHEHLGAEP